MRPVILVGLEMMLNGVPGTVVLTPERFAAMSRDLASVSNAVRETALQMLRAPGTPPTTVDPTAIAQAAREEPSA
jgi:hypothetical protein